MAYIVGDHIGWLTYLADSWSAIALTSLGLCLRIIRRRIIRIELTQEALTVEFDLEGIFGKKKAKHKSVSAK